MKKDKEISPIIYKAIEIIEKCFGGTDVELISDKMYRTSPDEFYPIGKLGVDIEINGIKTFLGCESMAEEIACNPFGKKIAEEFVHMILNSK